MVSFDILSYSHSTVTIQLHTTDIHNLVNKDGVMKITSEYMLTFNSLVNYLALLYTTYCHITTQNHRNAR